MAEWGPDSFAWLEREFRDVNDLGSLNCLFSDGRYLFAYHDKNGRGSLCYWLRRAPFGQADCPDLSKKIDWDRVYRPSASGVVVATKPLTAESWLPCPPGRLLAFKDGVQVDPAIAADGRRDSSQ